MEFIPNASNEDNFNQKIICREHTLNNESHRDLQQWETIATPRGHGNKEKKVLLEFRELVLLRRTA